MEGNGHYEGQWLDGMKDGFGKFVYCTASLETWPDNSYYEGEWREDRAEGKGKLCNYAFT
jgi:hypothetical protein